MTTGISVLKPTILKTPLWSSRPLCPLSNQETSDRRTLACSTHRYSLLMRSGDILEIQKAFHDTFPGTDHSHRNTFHSWFILKSISRTKAASSHEILTYVLPKIFCFPKVIYCLQVQLYYTWYLFLYCQQKERFF